MELKKYSIGRLVKPYNRTCGIPHLSADEVSGINREKEFFEPARQVGTDTSKYLVVPSGCFACNLMHVGRDCVLPIAFNRTNEEKIVSPAYSVFSILDDAPIIDEYFFMLVNSIEKDRYFWFHSDSSVRDGLPWEAFCEIEFNLPSLSIQQKYVDIYKAMVANQQSYECGLEDLKLVCDGYIEDLRRKMPCEKIGDYISELNNRNNYLSITNVQGVNSLSRFDETKANTNGLDFKNYKIVQTGNFAYNPSRINLGSIALLRNENCIVSPMYIVFRIIDVNQLLPEYLMLWFERKEFQRSTLFFATGSVRDTFTFDLMKEVRIPIPDIEVQKAIANIYKVYITRKQINEQLKEQIKNICPILIKGSLEEGE